MKRTYSLFLFPLVCLVLAAPAVAQVGGSYDLHWNVIAGGSGKATGGNFSLSGSIGQPATATLSGGSFALTGGFWTFRMPLLGDINDDGYVNVGDLQLLVVAWASQRTPPSSNWNANADLNSDGFVNVGDLQLLVQNWGQSAN